MAQYLCQFCSIITGRFRMLAIQVSGNDVPGEMLIIA
jgi:hypothetical protein